MSARDEKPKKEPVRKRPPRRRSPTATTKAKAPPKRARNAAPSKPKAAARKKPPAAKKKKKGTSVETRAKKAGAQGARLTATKTALRNALIVQRATVDRWSWPLIASEAGISEKQCRRVVADVKASPSPLDVTPTDLIEEWATGFRQSIGTFTVLAAGADNTAAAVGALKAANDARDKLIALMQAIGHVPHDLGMLKVQRDVEQIARRMLDLMDSLLRGDMTAEEVRDGFYELAGIPKVPELGPGDGAP